MWNKLNIMQPYEDFLKWPVFDLAAEEKMKMLSNKLKDLTQLHIKNCSEYKKVVESRTFDLKSSFTLGDIPWIPVRLFKYYSLKSIHENEIYKVLFSSGTTSQTPSRIYLDKYTSQIQAKVLVKIIQDFIGKKRLPMLIIDSPNTVKNKENFSARGAGILGLSNFGHSHTFALDDDMNLDTERINRFSKKFLGQPKIIFGFTFMVWKYFVKKLEENGDKLNLNDSTLFHSGGWKKIQSEAVDNSVFKEKLKTVTSISKVHNFYGLFQSQRFCT